MGGGAYNSTWNGLEGGNTSAKAKTVIAVADIMQIITQTQTYQNAITLENFDLSTNGGHFFAHGQSAGESTGYGHIGVMIQRGCNILTGTGDITIAGTNASARNASGWYWGVLLASDRPTEPNIIETTSGTINITGNAANSFSFAHSGGIGIFEWIYAGGTGVNRIKTNNGNINLTGTNAHPSNSSYGGLVLVSNPASKEIVTQTGTITLTGITQNAAANGLAIGGEVKIGYDGVNACSGNINLVGDRMAALHANTRIQSSGILNIKPITNSTSIGIAGATGTLALPASYFSGNFADGFSNILIGSNTQSGDIAINTVTVNDNITLQTSGAVTQVGAISAPGQQLNLMGGNFTLTNAGNEVGKLTANAGTIAWLNNAAMQLNNITATGTLNISTASGNLTVAGNISTSNASAAAIRLGAGTGNNSGTAGGGNIILSGSPSITTGSGGVARLYTGAFSPSDGLYSYVSNNLNRVQFNADISTSTFNPALLAGVNILYRENVSWRAMVVPAAGQSIIIAPTGGFEPTLDGSYTVGNIYFNNAGKKIINPGYDYTLTGSAFGADANNYIQTNGTGRVRKNITHGESFEFPVGRSNYSPVAVANNTGSADIISVGVLDEVYADGQGGTALTGVRVKRTWDIHKVNPNTGAGLNFTFKWNAADLSSPMSTPALYHYDGSWQKQTGSTVVSGNSLTYEGYTGSFSPFAVLNGNITLPVSWLSVAGAVQQNQVQLKWATAAELNAKAFHVQHSTDGIRWVEIGSVRATGNSNTISEYSFTHHQPKAGTNNYRLQQHDVDGSISYSKVIRINYNESAKQQLQLFPNPASSGFVNLKLSQPATVQIINATGAVVWQQALSTGTHTVATEKFAKGIYHIKSGFGSQVLIIK